MTTKRQKTGGRKAGTPNKTTAAVKNAILSAAQQVGRDGEGFDGLVGYLRRVAINEPRAFCTLLAKVIPLQVEGPDGQPLGETVVQVYLPDNGRPTVPSVKG